MCGEKSTPESDEIWRLSSHQCYLSADFHPLSPELGMEVPNDFPSTHPLLPK